MSTFKQKQCRCAVCHVASRFTVISSTNEFGSPDLDLRPPPMRRDTMSLWVQECPVCGYVADHIDKATLVKIKDLWSLDYLTCEGFFPGDHLIRRFYRAFLLAKKVDNLEGQIEYLLYAAWRSDDIRKQDLATTFRAKAAALVLDLIRRLQAQGFYCESYIVLRSDLLRRSGQFEELIGEYKHLLLSEEDHNTIISFELRLAEERDSGRYTVSQALDGENERGFGPA